MTQATIDIFDVVRVEARHTPRALQTPEGVSQCWSHCIRVTDKSGAEFNLTLFSSDPRNLFVRSSRKV